MGTTDVLLVVTIVLLLGVTGLNVNSGRQGRCPKPCPTYIPRPCEGFDNPFAEIERKEDMFISHGNEYDADDIDEMTNHPRGRGLVPEIRQPQHTKNLWKSAYTQPNPDEMGRRHTYFSSDLLTPYRDQYSLLKVNPYNKEVKPPIMGSSIFEDFAVHPFEDDVRYDNPLDNERDPTIYRNLV